MVTKWSAPLDLNGNAPFQIGMQPPGLGYSMVEQEPQKRGAKNLQEFLHEGG